MSKIFFACPIFNFQDTNIRKNHEFIRQTSEHEVGYFEVVGASVEHAKQIMYKEFLKGDCEYFLNVDADIVFLQGEENPIDKLVEANKDIIGGLYVLKRKPIRPSHRPLDLQEYYDKNGGFPKDYKFNIPNKLHEVKWLAGGCMLIKREVIEKLMDKYPVPNLPRIYNKEYLSEDYAFCQRAIEEGYKIYAEPIINLGHQGPYLYTFEDYQA